MSVRDPQAQSVLLDAVLGDGAAPGAPSAFRFLLFVGDPDEGGVELGPGGGYTPAVYANTTANFPDAVDGEKTVPVAFADATGAFVDPVSHWQMVDDANPDVGYFNGKWANVLNVLGAGPVTGVATIFFGKLL